MKVFVATVYGCDYCGKKYINRKSLAEKHEKYCFKNPLNRHKCFEDCRFLKITKVEYYEGEHGSCYRKAYYCEKLKQYMYSVVVERRGKLQQFREDDNVDCNMVRMPVECPEHKWKS